MDQSSFVMNMSKDSSKSVILWYTMVCIQGNNDSFVMNVEESFLARETCQDTPVYILESDLFLRKECGKGFIQKVHLVAHNRLHTGRKLSICNAEKDLPVRKI